MPNCGRRDDPDPGRDHIPGKVRNVFYIVGPTASGKSEIAAAVAEACEAEVVSADAFQIYQGLDLLTAKPAALTLARAPHHLISAVPLSEEMNAEKFRRAALSALDEIHARGKRAIVAGGSGLYIHTLTHGLSPLPAGDAKLRGELNALSTAELLAQLSAQDAQTARSIDPKNRRRLIRALEVCRLTGQPVSQQRQLAPPREAIAGVFLWRARAELYERINRRVEAMFAGGVVEEVRALGQTSQNAGQMLGLSEIREMIAGRISQAECIAAIQQATRRYAKRQLTWFRRQTNFEPLNLSLQGFPEAIEWISRKARMWEGPRMVMKLEIGAPRRLPHLDV